MKLEIKKDLHNLNTFSVISSLPDMGSVGGIVSSFLAKNLDTINIANIISLEKPWVSHSKGIVTSLVDEYKIYFSSKNKLLILTGDSQPQDSFQLYTLCNIFLEYVSSLGQIRRLYSAGGYLRQQVTGAPKVYGVVNNVKLIELIARNNINFVGTEITSITWFNGLILGLAARKNIDGIGLFGEISDTNIKQPLAAKSIVQALSKLENIQINTNRLDKEYENILEDLYSKKETQKFRSGIG
ncbi:MAG: PAC2 family protein [Nitrososphaeraceae archaeon]